LSRSTNTSRAERLKPVCVRGIHVAHRQEAGPDERRELRFTLIHLRGKALVFPPLEPFVDDLEARLLTAIAHARGISRQHLNRRFRLASGPLC
jgi:hypothetical protein